MILRTSVEFIVIGFLVSYTGHAESTCTDDRWIILCRLSNVTESTTIHAIYRMQLSIQKKNVERIVAINLVPPNTTLPTWNNQEIKERSSIEGSKLFPVNEAQLVLKFNRLECYDSGIYACNISGVDFNGEFNRYMLIPTNFTGCPCGDIEVTTAMNGNIQSSEPPLTSENTMHSTITNPSYSQQFSDISSSTTTTRMHSSSLVLTIVNSDNGQDSLVGNRSTNLRQTSIVEVINFMFIIAFGITTNIDS